MQAESGNLCGLLCTRSSVTSSLWQLATGKAGRRLHRCCLQPETPTSALDSTGPAWCKAVEAITHTPQGLVQARNATFTIPSCMLDRAHSLHQQIWTCKTLKIMIGACSRANGSLGDICPRR